MYSNGRPQILSRLGPTQILKTSVDINENRITMYQQQKITDLPKVR